MNKKSGFLGEMSLNQSKIRKTVPITKNQDNQSTSDPFNTPGQDIAAFPVYTTNRSIIYNDYSVLKVKKS